MKTYEGRDEKGRVIYFEVPNALLSRRAACKLVSRVPGVSIASESSSWFSARDDIFCRFQLNGKQFELWEPYGDSSRFHIAAKPLGPSTGLEELRKIFQSHSPVSGVFRWLLILFIGCAIWFRWHNGG